MEPNPEGEEHEVLPGLFRWGMTLPSPLTWPRRMFSNVSNEEASRLYRFDMQHRHYVELWAVFDNQQDLPPLAATGGKQFCLCIPRSGCVVASEQSLFDSGSVSIDVAKACSRREILAMQKDGNMSVICVHVRGSCASNNVVLKMIFSRGVFTGRFTLDMNGLLVRDGLATQEKAVTAPSCKKSHVFTSFFTVTVSSGRLVQFAMFAEPVVFRPLNHYLVRKEFRERQFYELVRASSLLYRAFDVDTISATHAELVDPDLNKPRWYPVCHVLGLAAMCRSSAIRHALIRTLMRLGASWDCKDGFTTAPAETLIVTIVNRQGCDDDEAEDLLQMVCPVWPTRAGGGINLISRAEQWFSYRCRPAVMLRFGTVMYDQKTKLPYKVEVLLQDGKKTRILCVSLF